MNYTENNTILCLDNLTVGYPNKNSKNENDKMNIILKDISLIEKDIKREGHNATGQTIAILGRSGRGKSTLFKCLTGLIKPTIGRVLIPDGNQAKEVCEGDVGFVDQKYTLFRHKTMYQILQYALRKDKRTKKEKDELIDQYLVEWDLIEHKHKYSNELSGGQRQRTAILEQMVTSKHFIVLDEPASGLDVMSIEKMKRAIGNILSNDELNTIIFSTHDLRLAVELADSIYIIGHPEPTSTYSTILKHFDLKQMGFAWEPWGDRHRNLVEEIKEIILNS
jgi:ABC-type nitrate/sulfonate/bicarbonate transport system ATPase subunit